MDNTIPSPWSSSDDGNKWRRPGFYNEIRKSANDLLRNGFRSGLNFSFPHTVHLRLDGGFIKTTTSSQEEKRTGTGAANYNGTEGGGGGGGGEKEKSTGTEAANNGTGGGGGGGEMTSQQQVQQAGEEKTGGEKEKENTTDATAGQKIISMEAILKDFNMGSFTGVLKAHDARNKSFKANVYLGRDFWEFHSKIVVPELAPHLKTILTLERRRAGGWSQRIAFEHQRNYLGITASCELRENPIIDFSALIGSRALAFGAEMSYDTSIARLAKFNWGLRYAPSSHTTVSMSLTDKGKTSILSGYFCHPETRTSVAVELAHRAAINATIIAFGARHTWDPETVTKVCIGTDGKVRAVLEHKLGRRLATVWGEVEMVGAQRLNTKVGLSVSWTLNQTQDVRYDRLDPKGI